MAKGQTLRDRDETLMTDRTPQAVQACHDLIGWIIPQLDKCPRLRRFTLGERLKQALLDILELLLEATEATLAGHGLGLVRGRQAQLSARSGFDSCRSQVCRRCRTR